MLHLAAGRAPLSEGLALLELPAVAAGLEELETDPQVLADRLHVLVRPTRLKKAPHHRLDVWARATHSIPSSGSESGTTIGVAAQVLGWMGADLDREAG